MSELLVQHHLLVEAEDRDVAEAAARRFFANNVLVRYEQVEPDSSHILSAAHPSFKSVLSIGLTGNRRAVENLIEELNVEGATDLQKWSDLKQGYATKLLHTLVHLMDGFFGIDSVLYNLVENSHQVSPNLWKRMKKQPDRYWLVPVEGRSSAGRANRVPLLRPFGRE